MIHGYTYQNQKKDILTSTFGHIYKLTNVLKNDKKLWKRIYTIDSTFNLFLSFTMYAFCAMLKYQRKLFSWLMKRRTFLIDTKSHE